MNTEASETPSAPVKSKTDRYVKLAFMAVALIVVGWVIVHQHLTAPLKGWGKDLPAALAQAAAEGRRVVVIAYDSPQNHDYKKLRRIVRKAGNIEALREADVIQVHARMDADDPLAKQFGITAFPTTLLIGPDGKTITRRVGYIGEVRFRTDFLKGKP